MQKTKTIHQRTIIYKSRNFLYAKNSKLQSMTTKRCNCYHLDKTGLLIVIFNEYILFIIFFAMTIVNTSKKLRLRFDTKSTCIQSTCTFHQFFKEPTLDKSHLCLHNSYYHILSLCADNHHKLS